MWPHLHASTAFTRGGEQKEHLAVSPSTELGPQHSGGEWADGGALPREGQAPVRGESAAAAARGH